MKQFVTLTTNPDTIPGLIGSAGSAGTDGDDIINGLWGNDIVSGTLIAAATLTTLDSIDGGLGQNTLNVNIQDTSATTPKLTALNTTKVQTVNVKSLGAVNVDTTAGFTGVTKLNITQAIGDVKATAAATTAIDVSGVTGTAGVKQVFTATFAGTEVGSNTTIAFDGVTSTLLAGNAAVIAAEFASDYNAAGTGNWVAVDNLDNTVTFTAKVAGVKTTVVSGGFVIGGTIAGDTTPVAVTVPAVPTTVGAAGTTSTVDGGSSQTVSVAKGGVTVGATTVTTGDISVTSSDQGGDVIAVDGGKAVTVKATASTGGTITVGQTDLATGAVDITSAHKAVAGTNANMGAITVTGGSTVNVTQTADTSKAAADTVGASLVQGAVNVTAGNTTTAVTVAQSDQAAQSIFAAGAAAKFQTQVVTFNALVAKNSVTVNGLTFTAAVNMTAEQVAQAFADLTSGDRQDDGGPTAKGIYTGINTAGFTTGAAVGATVTYTEVTAGTNAAAITPTTAQNGGTTAPTAPTIAAGITGLAAVPAVAGVLGVANGGVVINDNATKSITTITVDGYSAGAALGAGAGGSLDALTTLTLKNSGAGAATLTTTSTGSLTLNLTDVDGVVTLGTGLTGLTINTSGEASTGAIAAVGATTVTINAEAALSGAHSFTAATLIDVNGTAVVNLTGATTNAATLKTIDASDNTGGVTAVLGGTNSVKFTGGKGNDSLTLATAGTAATANIDMGDGNDTLTLGAGTTAANILGTIKGGDGTDTLAMGYADAVAGSANGALHAKAQGFERLTINDVAGVDNASVTYTVNLANLAYNYVTVNGTNEVTLVDTLAFTGMAANGTVAFGAGSTAGSLYTVALADDTAGTDVLNYVLASTGVTAAGTVGTPINAGTVTANAVETFSISSTAVDADGATNVIIANGDTVTTINASGNAGLNLKSTATTLKTVDASGLTGTGAAGGLVFNAVNASMTVSGGAGNDAITIAATADGSTFNGNGGNDTFNISAGADLVTIKGGAGADKFVFGGVSTNKSNYVVIDGVTSGDTFDLFALIGAGSTFNAAKITLSVGATESTQAYLDQAMTTLALNGAGWFQYGGNTFIAADVTADSLTTFVDGTDFVVMITGLVDLSTASFNATSSTLEIA